MSDYAPTEVQGLESGVNATAEDNSVSEDVIKGADLEVDQNNITSGERSAKPTGNLMEADNKADQAVEDSAGIPVGDE